MEVNEPNPTPRPGDPFTAQDGARLFADLKTLVDSMRADIRIVKAAVATLQNQHLTILETISRVEAGLSGSRFDRLALEIQEAELELEVAEKNLAAKALKLEKKKEVKDHTVDTQEKMRSLASNTYEEIAEKKRRDREAKIEEIKFSTLKAVITWGAVGGVGLVLGFLWYLIQLFINRGSP